MSVQMTTAPVRIQRRRSKGWRTPENCVIVSRPSRFGNPFTLALAAELGYENPRESVVGAFEEWLRGNCDMWQSDEGDLKRERILADLPLLRGLSLACTCPIGEKCHADVLIKWAALPESEWEAMAARIRVRVDRDRISRGDEPMITMLRD